MNVDLQVQIMMWVGGFLMTILGWIGHRLVGSVDGLREDIHKMAIMINSKPSWDDVKDEAHRASEELIIKHERDKH